MQQIYANAPPPPFQLEFVNPYSTFTDGTAQPIDFVVDGLMTAGGLSVLGAKPKTGKSSLSRHLAVCVASGEPFLGRETSQGEVLLVSLEDPLAHTDNALAALGYDPDRHAQINIVERVSHKRHDTLQALRKELLTRTDVKLIVVDHLSPFLGIADINEYVPVLDGVTELRQLARDFPRLHILCLVHAKKLRTEDPFDSLLGSTALRGAPDTNIVLLNESGVRVITSETRIGRAIPTTILNAEIVASAGCDVAKAYSLGAPFSQWESERKQKAEAKQTITYTRRVVEFLMGCDNHTTYQREVISQVTGKTERIVEAIKSLEDECIVTASGTPRQLHLNLEGEALEMYVKSLGGNYESH